MGGYQKFLRGEHKRFVAPQHHPPPPTPSHAYESINTTIVHLDGDITSVVEELPPSTGQSITPHELGPESQESFDFHVTDESLLGDEPPQTVDKPIGPRCPNQVSHSVVNEWIRLTFSVES